MEFKSVAILGAGAVGSYMLWGLSNKKNIDLFLVADGERKERLEKNGLLINEKAYFPKVKTPKEAHGVDLLLVTTKYTALADSLSDIKEVVGESTTIVSLLNGIDSEEVIGKEVGMEKIIYSVIKVASERIGNSICFDPDSTIGVIFGEIDKTHPGDRCDALANLFKDTGLHYRKTDVILSEMWSKFRLNVSNNQPQAILNCGVGAYTDSEHAAFIQQKLKEEVETIAKAKGIDLSLADTSSGKGSPVQKRARYSTLQDLDAKRHTEVDMFAGAIVRMGKELGIPTPFNEMTYHIIKALEEKNDGKFEF